MNNSFFIFYTLNRDATFLSLLDTFTSFVAGATVFSVMGFLAKSTGKEISDLIGDGEAGIAFIAYPTAIAEFKAPQVYKIKRFHDPKKIPNECSYYMNS